jgi:hypothetical protein
MIPPEMQALLGLEREAARGGVLEFEILPF